MQVGLFTNRFLFCFIISAFSYSLSNTAHARDYHAHPQGSGTECTFSQPCSLTTLNGKLQAGDTGYLKGGDYYEHIAPANNGLADRPITYARYQTEDVYIKASVDQADIREKRYIIIDGLNFRDALRSSLSYWVWGTNSTGCVIKNCSFRNTNGLLHYGGVVCGSSDLLRLENNIFYDAPDSGDDDCSVPCDFVTVGDASRTVIQGNRFGRVSHSALGFRGQGTKSLIRNNTFDNPWHTNFGAWAFSNNKSLILVELNVSRNGGSDYLTNPSSFTRRRTREEHPGIQDGGGGTHVIVRRNVFYNNGAAIAYGTSSIFGNDIKPAEGNHSVSDYFHYNNVSDHDYWGLNVANYYGYENNVWSASRTYNVNDVVVVEGRAYKCVLTHTNVRPPNSTYWFTYQGAAPAAMLNSHFINNSVTRPQAVGYAFDVYPLASMDQVYLTNNNFFPPDGRYRSSQRKSVLLFQSDYPSFVRGNISVEPKFADLDANNFHLQPDSPLIDGGAWLTRITSQTSSGSSFVVEHAGFFFDGWTIPGEAGDTIKTQNGQTAVILSINYDTNQLTLDRSITWVQYEGIALNYNGSRPDIGAFEFDGTPPCHTVAILPAMVGKPAHRVPMTAVQGAQSLKTASLLLLTGISLAEGPLKSKTAYICWTILIQPIPA